MNVKKNASENLLKPETKSLYLNRIFGNKDLFLN